MTITTTGDATDVRASVCAPGRLFTPERNARAWPDLPPIAAAVWV